MISKICLQKLVLIEERESVQLFATPWNVACQAPLSMGFSRQKYWRGWPFPSPGDLPNPGIELWSLALQADALASRRFTIWASREAPLIEEKLKKKKKEKNKEEETLQN